MKFKILAVVLMTFLMLMCTGCTNSYTMSKEVEMWNTATEATKTRYAEVKELGIANEEAMLNLLVFNKYDESLIELFENKEEKVGEEGRPVKNFLNRVRDYEREDGYDAYYFEYARAHNIAVEDLYDALCTFSKGDTTKDLSDFLFLNPTIKTHKFFTSLNTPTVTEVFQIQGESGSVVTAIIVWKDNKIIFVTRSL